MGGSALNPRFLVAALIVGLVLAGIASSGLMFSGTPPVAVGREFKLTMKVPEGADANGVWLRVS